MGGGGGLHGGVRAEGRDGPTVSDLLDSCSVPKPANAAAPAPAVTDMYGLFGAGYALPQAAGVLGGRSG